MMHAPIRSICMHTGGGGKVRTRHMCGSALEHTCAQSSLESLVRNFVIRFPIFGCRRMGSRLRPRVQSD